MTRTLTLVLCMAVVTWLTLLAASMLRARAWTLPGLKLAFGNRDDLPEPTPLAGRAERTARNTQENFLLFAVIALVAHAIDAENSQVALGAELFFWSRVVFIPVYYAGITYVRTAVWFVSIVGLAMMLTAIV